LNIFGVISLFGSLQGFILAMIFFFNRKFNTKANNYLGLLLLVFTMLNLLGVFAEAKLFDKIRILTVLPIVWYSIIPPVFSLFIKYITDTNYRIKRLDLILFLPFIIDIFFQTFELFSYLSGNPVGRSFKIASHNIFESIAVILTIILLINSIRALSNYEESLYNQFAEINDKSLKWMKNTLIAGFALAIVWLFTAYLDFLPQQNTLIANRLNWIGLSIMIYWIGFGMLIRQEIFIKDTIIYNSEREFEEIPKQSEKTDNYYKKLLGIMDEDQLYKDPNLNMDQLSQAVGLSKSYLSQIINKREERNFFEFINAYRIEEVKKKFKDTSYDHYSILGIALEAGFKSKSTFNLVFKKSTGLTPSQYRTSKKPKN